MNKDKLTLICIALAYSMFIGSLVYIWEEYKELWVFLQIVALPAIYYIGYEILMDKQKTEMEKERYLLKHIIEILTKKVEMHGKKLKKKHI